jgi:hypothetical protein
MLTFLVELLRTMRNEEIDGSLDGERADRPGDAVMAEDDPFLWLEEIESEQALDWAREQNERSEALLKATRCSMPSNSAISRSSPRQNALPIRP